MDPPVPRSSREAKEFLATSFSDILRAEVSSTKVPVQRASFGGI